MDSVIQPLNNWGLDVVCGYGRGNSPWPVVWASREGDGDLHLHYTRMMIRSCFAYDKMNYSRYLTLYFAQMTNLGDKNPEVQKAFKVGSFSVQLASSNPFGRIPVQQTTEVTVNKDTQNPGGTTRFSLQPPTAYRASII